MARDAGSGKQLLRTLHFFSNSKSPAVSGIHGKALSKRESFLLRLDPKILAALRRWADDELRSLNGQLEYVLRNALRESGRLPRPASEPAEDTEKESDEKR